MTLKSGHFVFDIHFHFYFSDFTSKASIFVEAGQYRGDSPFSHEQANWIVLKFGEFKSISMASGELSPRTISLNVPESRYICFLAQYILAAHRTA